MSRCELVALDVDGTLMSYDGIVSDEVREAVLAVRDSGRHVVLATGRSAHSAVPVARELGLTDGWLVASNGAVTVRLDPEVDGGHEIHKVVTFDATSQPSVSPSSRATGTAECAPRPVARTTCRPESRTASTASRTSSDTTPSYDISVPSTSRATSSQRLMAPAPPGRPGTASAPPAPARTRRPAGGSPGWPRSTGSSRASR